MSSSANDGAGLPTSGEWNSADSPASVGTNSALASEASALSAACLRYSQLAQPAHAKIARINRTAMRTKVLRRKGRTSHLYCTSGDHEQEIAANRRLRQLNASTPCSPGPLFHASKLVPSETDEHVKTQR